MAQVVEKTTAEEENTFHYYTGNAIPWFVRALWILFWCGAIAYVVTWLLPALQSELTRPAMTTPPRATGLRLLRAATARKLVGRAPAAGGRA